MARSQTAKRVFGAILIGAVLALAWFAADALREAREARRTRAYVQEIVSMLDLAAIRDFHQRVDKVRVFINDNSIFSIDERFWKNKASPSSFAAGVLAYSKGTAPEPVHMECSTRTNLIIFCESSAMRRG